MDTEKKLKKEAPAEKEVGNPKDAIGSAKIPLGLIPYSALCCAALAHYEGNLKYGRWNWRGNKVRASIYLDALNRHIAKWVNGEAVDPVTRVPHLGSAIACLNIIIDAAVQNKLIDDRPPKQEYAELEAELSSVVGHLSRLHADKNPRHYTILDHDC